MAIRDMDIAAEIIGVNPLKAKLSAFASQSGFYIGIAGALYLFAVYLGAAEAGDSIRHHKSHFLVLFMIIIGGLGSIFGSFAGAAFMMLLPVCAEKHRWRWTNVRLAHRSSQRTWSSIIVGALDHGVLDLGEPHGMAATLARSEGEITPLALPALKRGATEQYGANAPFTYRTNHREETAR